MMADKEKQATSNTFLIRSGGLALSLPIVIVLAVLLMLLNVMMGSILFLTLISDGTGIFADIGAVSGALSLTFLLSMATMIGLIYSVLRYTGGIRKLWGRLRGIQEERERVERLMEREKIVEDVELQGLIEEQELENKL